MPQNPSLRSGKRQYEKIQDGESAESSTILIQSFVEFSHLHQINMHKKNGALSPYAQFRLDLVSGPVWNSSTNSRPPQVKGGISRLLICLCFFTDLNRLVRTQKGISGSKSLPHREKSSRQTLAINALVLYVKPENDHQGIFLSFLLKAETLVRQIEASQVSKTSQN
jgi:hypothetical protein